jgi:hypothetical protein
LAIGSQAKQSHSKMKDLNKTKKKVRRQQEMLLTCFLERKYLQLGWL